MSYKSPAAFVALALTVVLTACGDSGAANAGGMAAAAAPSKTAAPAGVAKPGAARQGLYEVVDKVGFNKPTTALRVDAPAGWNTESAVRWDNFNGQCSNAIASPMFRLTSPDGRASIEQFPGFLVTTNEQDIRRRGSSPGDFCILAMAESGEALMQRVAVPFLRPQSRILSIRALPLTPDVASLGQRIQQASVVGGMRVVAYVTEALIANPDNTQEKITLGGVILVGQQMLPGVPPLVLNQNMYGYSVRAPADQMAATEAMAARVRQSVQVNPEWQRVVQDYQNRMTRPVFPKPGAVASSSSGSASNGPDWIDKTKNAWDAGQAVDDDIQRKRIESIREEHRCPRPGGGYVLLPIDVPCG